MNEKNLIESIQAISARCKALRMGTESLNIIEMLRLDKNVLETAHSRALKEFLSAGEGYGYPFFKIFLATVELEALKYFKPNYFHCEKFNIDILITGKIAKEEYAIIIENKINEAGDQEEQIERYISTVKNYYNCKEQNIYVLYLVSGQGKIIPAEHSISSERREYFEKRGQFITITYIEDIVKFLDKILATWSNESIRTAAYQYQEYIKDIYGINDKERGYVKMENDILYKELKLDEEAKPSQKLFDFLNNIEKTKSSVYQLLGKELLHDIHSLYKDSSSLFDDEVVVDIPFTFGEQREELRLHVKNKTADNMSIYLEQEDDFFINAQKRKISAEMNKCIRSFFPRIPYKKRQNFSNSESFFTYNNTDTEFTYYYNYLQVIREWVKLYSECELQEIHFSGQWDFNITLPILYKNEKKQIKLELGNADEEFYFGFNLSANSEELNNKIQKCFAAQLKPDHENNSLFYCLSIHNSVKEFKETIERIKQIS